MSRRAFKNLQADSKPPKKLAKYLPAINSKFERGVSNIKKIFDELKLDGYNGSYGLLYKYLKTAKKSKLDRALLKSRPIRFETKPGEQAQVDWASFGEVSIGGKKKKLSAFVFILSWSRMLYIEFVVGKTLPVFQQCHLNAFEKLGIPDTIVYDNMKTVVNKRRFQYGLFQNHIYNSGFEDFARFFGFNIFLCTPRKPRSKGKVESAVKYLKRNFNDGLQIKKDFSSLEDVNKKVQRWLNNIANSRVHKTTSEIPLKRWLIERKCLQSFKNFPEYHISTLARRRSTQSGMVQYKDNFYSLPLALSGKEVLVEENNKNGLPHINISYKNTVVARHPLSQTRGEWISKDEHIGLGKTSSDALKFKKVKSLKSRNKFPKVAFARDFNYYNQLILGKNSGGGE